MKNNIPRLYKYGNFVNTIYFALSFLLLTIGIIMVVVGVANDNKFSLEKGSETLGSGIHLLAATILCSIFVINKAEKEVEQDLYKSLAPHILAIVFGALASTVTLVGGIFGLIVEGKEEILAEGDKKVEQITEMFHKGLFEIETSEQKAK